MRQTSIINQPPPIWRYVTTTSQNFRQPLMAMVKAKGCEPSYANHRVHGGPRPILSHSDTQYFVNDDPNLILYQPVFQLITVWVFTVYATFIWITLHVSTSKGHLQVSQTRDVKVALQVTHFVLHLLRIIKVRIYTWHLKMTLWGRNIWCNSNKTCVDGENSYCY
jgi:hypothetical protein